MHSSSPQSPDSSSNQPDPQASTNEPMAPVDLARLSDVTGGLPEMMREIFVAYLEQAGEILHDIDSAIQHNDQELVRRAAHKLGGSSATCGITEVAASLKRLEHLGSAYTAESAKKLHATAVKQLAEADLFIQQHLESI